MIEYSLDTNACIAVINGTSPALRTMIAEAIGEGSVLCVSTVVLHELWFGAAKSARALRCGRAAPPLSPEPPRCTW